MIAMSSSPCTYKPTVFPRQKGRPQITPCSAMFPPQPPSLFPLMGDCIGEESCADLMSLLERPTGAGHDEAAAAAAVESRVRMRSARRWEVRERRKEKEYPPPIPSLARTENLQSRMPWVLTRTYTADGRLILREEPVSHHEYFRAHRRDGRLTLQLVPLDDEAVFDLEDAEPEPEPEADTAPSCVGDNDNHNRDDDYLQCPEAEGDDAGCNESTADHREPVLAAVAEMGGGVGKCLKGYDISGGSSSCIFGVAVPALRPVHG